MRLVAVAVVVLGFLTTARADDKALKPYAGQVVMSPDTPPASFDELPAFLKANATKDGHYELVKWEVNFVGVTAKAADKVTLVVTDPEKPAEPLISIELAAKRLVVVGHFTPTKAAGFAAHKPYAITLVSGKTTLAKAELELR